jgi:hypothetical protein
MRTIMRDATSVSRITNQPRRLFSFPYWYHIIDGTMTRQPVVLLHSKNIHQNPIMEEKEPETREDTPEPQSDIAAANGQNSSLAANTQDAVADEMKEKESGDGKQLSKIEMLMDKIETRRDQRREVTRRVRREFIDICEERVAKLGGSELNAIPFNELVRMKEEYVNDLGLYEVLQLAVKCCEEVKSDRFYFRDFDEYRLVRNAHCLNFGDRTSMSCTSDIFPPRYLLDPQKECLYEKSPGRCTHGGFCLLLLQCSCVLRLHGG